MAEIGSVDSLLRVKILLWQSMILLFSRKLFVTWSTMALKIFSSNSLYDFLSPFCLSFKLRFLGFLSFNPNIRRLIKWRRKKSYNKFWGDWSSNLSVIHDGTLQREKRSIRYSFMVKVTSVLYRVATERPNDIKSLILNRCSAKLWKPNFFFYYYYND